jgi:hemerythrin superfamily protein
MARAKSKSGKRAKSASSSGSRTRSASGSAARSDGRAMDAIALLKADHRTAEDLFAQFEKARDDQKRQTLATQVCNALKVHTQIEEEIFYPAFLEQAQDEEIHHEAEVEHNGAKKLIAEIEQSSPDDDYFHAKVHVLAEMIKHHVREEEKPGGMFAKAKSADMDLQALGEKLAQRKTELEGDMEDEESMSPPGGGRGSRAGTERHARSKE